MIGGHWGGKESELELGHYTRMVGFWLGCYVAYRKAFGRDPGGLAFCTF